MKYVEYNNYPAIQVVFESANKNDDAKTTNRLGRLISNMNRKIRGIQKSNLTSDLKIDLLSSLQYDYLHREMFRYAFKDEYITFIKNYITGRFRSIIEPIRAEKLYAERQLQSKRDKEKFARSQQQKQQSAQ